MEFITPSWAKRLGVTAGLSTRDQSWPNNGSLGTSDTGHANRQRLLEQLGLNGEVFRVDQVHGDTVMNADTQPTAVTGDAIIAHGNPSPIGVMVADCPAVLLYDPTLGVRAAIHSGWRGTAKNIVAKTVAEMKGSFGTDPANLWAWISPAVQASSYEVELDVADLFDDKYLSRKNQIKYLLDVPGCVYDQLVDSGVPVSNIEQSQIDSITDTRIHSARRDSPNDGRALALISQHSPAS